MPVACDRCNHIKRASQWHLGICNDCLLGGAKAISGALPLIPAANMELRHAS